MPLSREELQRANAYREALGQAYISMIKNRAELWDKVQRILRRWLEARGQGGNDRLYEVLLGWAAHVMLRQYLAHIEKDPHSPAQSDLRLMTSEDFWETHVGPCVPVEIHNSYDTMYEVISRTAKEGRQTNKRARDGKPD